MKCRKNTDIRNPKGVSAENSRIMLLWKWSVDNCKSLKFLKEQETRWLFSNVAWVTIPIPSDLPILPILNTFYKKYNMTVVVNELLLEEDTFMPGMYLKQPKFTYRACDSLT